MIAALDSVARLQFTDPFRATAPRNHDAKSLFEPLRQSHHGQLRNPAPKMSVRKLMREDCRETLALGGEQNRREHDTAHKCHADCARISQSVCGNEGLSR